MKGLIKLQNLLLFIGFLLLPLLFWAHSFISKLCLSLAFLSIFWGFRRLEKKIHHKLKKQRQAQIQKDIEYFRNVCLENIQYLEEIFIRKGYSIKHNTMLDSLYQKLSSCRTVEDFLSLKEEIRRRTFYVAEMTSNETKKKEQSKQFSKETTTPKASKISQSLQVLGLSEDTKDIILIKKAYKDLIKKYHPDINPSSEAEAKVVELNVAYNALKNHIRKKSK